MRHIIGEDRHQTTLLPDSLNDFVASDHPVRVIDAFVDSLDMAALGFTKAKTKETGRKPYFPGDLLKLYIYGYLNRITTSRRLETECHRNLEVLWLMRRLQPDFKTIADFRKDNAMAIRAVSRAFVEFCRDEQLLSKELFAIDGSKFKAAGSKDRTVLRRHLTRDRKALEARMQRYLDQLDEADQEDAEMALDKTRVQNVLQKLKDKQVWLDQAEQAMDEDDKDEHTDTEPEARMMRSGRDGIVLGYNVQSAVEAQSGLIVHHEVTNAAGDNQQLWPMARQVREVLGLKTFEVLADAGYSKGEDLAYCEAVGIQASVPRRSKTSSYKDKYQKKDFTFDAETNSYTCPAGEQLVYTSTDYQKNYHSYERKGCDTCALQSQCTVRDRRMITRHLFEDALDRSQERVDNQPGFANIRMSIAERPFAMIKQILGFRRMSCRGLSGAQTETSLAILSYNLKTMIGRVGVAGLLERLA